MDEIPLIGLGTSNVGTRCTEVVLEALECGYKHIDCATYNGNEDQVGAALDVWFASHARDSVWVTTKLWNDAHTEGTMKVQFCSSLARLGLRFVDLLLLHWPVTKQHISLQQTWRIMEALKREGLCRRIGVSNFTAPLLLDLLNYATIPPYINQIESHLIHQQKELIVLCLHNNVHVTAYSKLDL